jgi:hypothetical protein
MSAILLSEIQNQTLLRIIGAQKAINIATGTLPDEATINTLSRKQQEGISVTFLFQNETAHDSTLKPLTANVVNAIHINQKPATKNYTVIDNTEVIITDTVADVPCAYTITENEIVQKYLAHFFKRISQNTYNTQTQANASQLAVHQSNEAEELRFAVEELENLLVITDNEQQEVERIVRNYTHQFNQHLGSLLEEILTMKRQYAETHRHENEFAEREYQEAKQREEQFHEERVSEAKEGYIELNEEQKDDLKKLYREAVLKCHPDKVSEEMQEKASELTKQLNDAYRKQDIETIKQILADLKNGILSSTAKAEEKTIDSLRAKLEYLKNKLQNQTRNLLANKQDKTFVTASTYHQDPEHFENIKTELQKEYEFWRQQQSQTAE